MATLQVKGIDDRLYEALRRRAISDHRSISQEVVHIISDYLSKPRDGQGATAEFLELCGAWESEETPELMVAELRKDRHSRGRGEEYSVFD